MAAVGAELRASLEKVSIKCPEIVRGEQKLFERNDRCARASSRRAQKIRVFQTLSRKGLAPTVFELWLQTI